MSKGAVGGLCSRVGQLVYSHIQASAPSWYSAGLEYLYGQSFTFSKDDTVVLDCSLQQPCSAHFQGLQVNMYGTYRS